MSKSSDVLCIKFTVSKFGDQCASYRLAKKLSSVATPAPMMANKPRADITVIVAKGQSVAIAGHTPNRTALRRTWPSRK